MNGVGATVSWLRFTSDAAYSSFQMYMEDRAFITANKFEIDGDELRWTFARRLLDVRWTFAGCSLDVRWTFAGRSLDVR